MNIIHALFLAVMLLVLPFGAGAEPVVITAVGDILPAGSATALLRQKGYDYPFSGVLQELQKADIVVGNLEAPLALTGSEYRGKRFRFRINPAAGRALKDAGFTVLTLANNHLMDFGPAALEETLSVLDCHGIRHAGAGTDLAAAREPAVLEVKGRRFAFLAYSLTLPVDFFATPTGPGTAPGYPRYIIEDIGKARRSADHVIVSLHWGREGSRYPTPYQRNLGRAVIDAGADLVLGHHPHVLQGVERYGKGLIFYSLGNFAFGSLSATATTSAMVRLTFDEGLQAVEILPLNVDNRRIRFRPQLLQGAAADRVISHLNRISAGMGTEIVPGEGRFLLKQVLEASSSRAEEGH